MLHSLRRARKPTHLIERRPLKNGHQIALMPRPTITGAEADVTAPILLGLFGFFRSPDMSGEAYAYPPLLLTMFGHPSRSPAKVRWRVAARRPRGDDLARTGRAYGHRPDTYRRRINGLRLPGRQPGR